MDIKVSRINGDSYGLFVDGNLFQAPSGEKETRLLAEFLREVSAGKIEEARLLITTEPKDLEDA